MAAYTLRARVRCLPSGNVAAISDSAAGAAIAAPTPWSARAVIKQPSLVARPPNSDESENTRIPLMNSRRRPKISPGRPPSCKKPPNVSA